MAHPEKIVSLPATYSAESEEAVIGSSLIDRAAWERAAGRVDAEDFYRPDNREIALAFGTLTRKRQPIDVVTVAECLQSSGRLESAGGFAYLARLARETATAANVEIYAEAVRERSTIRKLRAFGEEFLRALDDARGRSAEELVAAAEQQLFDLRARARVGKGLISSRQLAGELIDELDQRREKLRGLGLGLVDFDELTSGLEPGDLVVIAARPGMGKTALMISVASTVSKLLPVAIFSAEMPSTQLMRRCIALLTDISQGKLRRAEQLTDADWAAITTAAAVVAERRLWIDDTSLPTLTHVRSESVAQKVTSGLGLVLVDYCQLVQGDGANRYEQLRDVAYGFKALAKDLQVPVILLAQLNRGVESREDKRPHLSDLRDSGAIEEAADIVGLLYSRAYYDKDFGMPYVLECAIEKNRNGERGQCLWQFEGAFSRITALNSGAAAQYRHLCTKQHQRAGNDL
jgi:replicative DNA helicase